MCSGPAGCAAKLIRIQERSKMLIKPSSNKFLGNLSYSVFIAICLMSCSTVFGGCCFGNGVILTTFQLSGMTPCCNEELIMAQIGSSRTKESSLRILFGIKSGPDDFCSERLLNSLNTSIVSTMYLSGTGPSLCLISDSLDGLSGVIQCKVVKSKFGCTI